MALKAVIAALVALVAVSSCAGQSHPLTDLPPAGQITTGYFFPDHGMKRFPAGDKIKVVVGVHNDGSKPYNVTAVMGSLNSPMEFSIYVQNFTQQLYFTPLQPGEELSVEYVFRPDPNLSPRDFVVALTLFYEDEQGAMLSSTFFNGTVEIVEQKKMIDTEMLFLYLILLGIASGIGYLIYEQVVSMGLIKKAKKSGSGNRSSSRSKAAAASAANGASAGGDDDDWIKGTPYDALQKKKAASAKKSS